MAAKGLSEARAKQGKKAKSASGAQKEVNINIKQDANKPEGLTSMQIDMQNTPALKNTQSQAMLQSLISEASEDMQMGDGSIKKEQKEGGKDASMRTIDSMLVQNKTSTERALLTKDNILSFANQIKESIKNYKPPFTRLSLELNPKELGRVEVTITQKGRDLQISITSNTQAITLFAQNQNDLRNNLQNIGFNQVDMSFSQSGGGMHGNGEGDSPNRQKGNKNGLQVYEQANNLAEGVFDSLEIRLPKYA